MNKLSSIAFVSVLSLTGAAAEAGDPPAEEIMRKGFRAMKLDGAESLNTLTIFNPAGKKRVRKIASVSKLYDDGETEKRLIRFVSPPDVKGTGLLTYDYENKSDDMWLYMPALRKTRRIVASEKAKNFMGSEFTYADITPPRVEDFSHTILRSEKAGGVDCWVIESVPRSDEVADENGFSKRVSHIGKEDHIVRKSIYYDLDGELHKELTAFDVKEIDTVKHRYRPMRMEMVNKHNGRRSEMRFDKIQLRRDIPDEYFTVRYLERE